MKINKIDFEKILKDSAEKYSASDLHISEKNEICLRRVGLIDRQFSEYSTLTSYDTVNLFEIIVGYLSESAEKFVKNRIKKKSHAGFSLNVGNNLFRVNASRLGDGYYIVLRFIEKNPPNIEDLNFFPETEAALRAIAELDSGLFLVVGPTGSGKTTTLSAVMKHINKNFSKNIISLEDPIEYIHDSIKSNIVQKEFGRDFPEFKEALTSLLREDPDVAYVGEIRDEETLALALQISETGHLVIATLHTDSSVESIQRMVSMSSTPELTRSRLKTSLRGVMAQKLKPYEDPNDLNEHNQPKKKRILIWEQLTVNHAVANMIKEGEESSISGMLDNIRHSNSYNKVLLKYCKNNVLSFETAVKFSHDRDSFISSYNQDQD